MATISPVMISSPFLAFHWKLVRIFQCEDFVIMLDSSAAFRTLHWKHMPLLFSMPSACSLEEFAQRPQNHTQLCSRSTSTLARIVMDSNFAIHVTETFQLVK